MVAHKLLSTYKIREEKVEEWTVCYTGLADIVDDFETLSKAC